MIRTFVIAMSCTVLVSSCGDAGESDDPGSTGGSTNTSGSVPTSDADPTSATAMSEPTTADDSSGLDDTGASMPCGPYTPGLALEVCSAGYLSGPGDDGARSVAIAADGTVLWGGSISGGDLGLTPVVLEGATNGALVRLASDGRTALSLTRYGTVIEDVAVAPDGTIVVAADTGIAALAPDGGAIAWSANIGATQRIAVGDDAIVGLADGELHVFDASGNEGAAFSAGGGAINDLAVVDGQAIVTGFKQDDGAPCTQLQIPFLRAFASDGAPTWTAYDWNKDQVGAADQCADTRGMALARGGDGMLYYAGESHGSNSVHQRMPDDLAADAPNVKTDPYNDPYGLNGAAPITYYARFDPSDGRILLGQFLLTRLSDGKGNAVRPSAIAADDDGRVVVVGGTACCIDSGTERTVNGEPAMPEAYQGGGFVMIAAADFSSRMTWTTVRGELGNAETAVAAAVAGGNVAVAFHQSVDEGSTLDVPLLTFDAVQSEPGGGVSDGYLLVFPAP